MRSNKQGEPSTRVSQYCRGNMPLAGRGRTEDFKSAGAAQEVCNMAAVDLDRMAEGWIRTTVPGESCSNLETLQLAERMFNRMQVPATSAARVKVRGMKDAGRRRAR